MGEPPSFPEPRGPNDRAPVEPVYRKRGALPAEPPPEHVPTASDVVLVSRDRPSSRRGPTGEPFAFSTRARVAFVASMVLVFAVLSFVEHAAGRGFMPPRPVLVVVAGVGVVVFLVISLFLGKVPPTE